ncbi:FeoA family protein [Gloeocapsa sp. PCC 73106]|uniref:FeoA family protein n=1 Tax=Gloeocapsa sp. PCC 73106 TaxID=102232 RepID=UPI0002ACBABD|nr:FeoA family protein [Gloeocapsa sp. PCC 73106]ELR98261.1 Fe2+ transport system protein A [Gloeocapsa sp. PCC 73106]
MNWRFSYWGGNGEEFNQSEIDNSRLSYPLSQAELGARVWVIGFSIMGLNSGEMAEIIHIQPSGSVLLKIGDQTVGLGAEMTSKILVSDCPPDQLKALEMATDTRTYIREMEVGTLAQIVGYDKILQGYQGKLLAMGLKPGIKFTVISVPPFGDPVKIRVEGMIITLPKQEADALVVEVVEEN